MANLLTGVSASRFIHIATYRNIVFVALVCYTGQPAALEDRFRDYQSLWGEINLMQANMLANALKDEYPGS